MCLCAFFWQGRTVPSDNRITHSHFPPELFRYIPITEGGREETGRDGVRTWCPRITRCQCGNSNAELWSQDKRFFSGGLHFDVCVSKAARVSTWFRNFYLMFRFIRMLYEFTNQKIMTWHHEPIFQRQTKAVYQTYIKQADMFPLTQVPSLNATRAHSLPVSSPVIKDYTNFQTRFCQHTSIKTARKFYISPVGLGPSENKKKWFTRWERDDSGCKKLSPSNWHHCQRGYTSCSH